MERTCSKCGNALDLETGFHRKGAGRWDSWCKDCRSTSKKAAYQPAGVRGPEPQATMPYQGFVVLSSQVADERGRKPHDDRTAIPQEPSKKADFELWERRYGGPLNDADRLEIRENLSSFVTLMHQQWAMVSGF